MAETLLEVQEVGKRYRVGQTPVPALEDVSFQIRKGEVFAVVGESGSGKTTLANLILGIEAPTEGTIFYKGQPLGSERPRRLRRLIQYVQQNPWTTLNPKRTVYQSVVLPIAVHGLVPPNLRRQAVARLLELVDLGPEYLDRYPQALSGGQRQRVAIARALAAQPELLVLDEPTSALDVSVQAKVLAILAELRERLALTYLFITHDLTVVRNLADRVLVLYRGRVMEEGPTEALFLHPLHPYTRMLLAAVPVVSEEEAALRPEWPWERVLEQGEGKSSKGCPFAPRCPFAEARCWQAVPRMEEVAAFRKVACHVITREVREKA